MTTDAPHPSDDEKTRSQVLTFVLGTETYGIDILRVQEIRCWSSVTKIPHSPTYVLGVLNLRGSIVPIVDLRKRFNLEQADYTATTVVIVISVRGDSGWRNVGIVVDGVSDVVDIPPTAVKPAPHFGSDDAARPVREIASVGQRMIILLDADRLSDVSSVANHENDVSGETQPAVV